MKKSNKSLKLNKGKKSRGTQKNRRGGQLGLPGAGTFNFAGSNVGSWVNGLGVPVVLVGLRELMKGSKKNKQKGGRRKNRSSRRRAQFGGWGSEPSFDNSLKSYINKQNGGGWGEDFWSKLPFHLGQIGL